MSDLTLFAENIRTAMDAMEEVQEAEEVLRMRANRENYKAFRVSMETLIEHLNHVKNLLAHEDEVALDELGDALSHAFHGQTAEYRHADGHGQ
jgi:hypothetical protein